MDRQFCFIFRSFVGAGIFASFLLCQGCSSFKDHPRSLKPKSEAAPYRLDLTWVLLPTDYRKLRHQIDQSDGFDSKKLRTKIFFDTSNYLLKSNGLSVEMEVRNSSAALIVEDKAKPFEAPYKVAKDREQGTNIYFSSKSKCEMANSRRAVNADPLVWIQSSSFASGCKAVGPTHPLQFLADRFGEGLLGSRNELDVQFPTTSQLIPLGRIEVWRDRYPIPYLKKQMEAELSRIDFNNKYTGYSFEVGLEVFEKKMPDESEVHVLKSAVVDFFQALGIQGQEPLMGNLSKLIALHAQDSEAIEALTHAGELNLKDHLQ